jgi:hypothetical protein
MKDDESSLQASRLPSPTTAKSFAFVRRTLTDERRKHEAGLR